MAKKPKQAGSGPTRCDEGGQEFTPLFLPANPNEPIELVITLCKSAFLVHVFYGGEKVLEADSTTLPNDEARIVLPQKPAGVYALNWGYLPATADWQVKSEVLVSGAVRFRQRKSSDSGHPTNHSFVYVEIRA